MIPKMMTMMTMMTMMEMVMTMMVMAMMTRMMITKLYQVVQTHIIPSDDTIDADVIQVLKMF